jgi:hypothetical protein
MTSVIQTDQRQKEVHMKQWRIALLILAVVVAASACGRQEVQNAGLDSGMDAPTTQGSEAAGTAASDAESPSDSANQSEGAGTSVVTVPAESTGQSDNTDPDAKGVLVTDRKSLYGTWAFIQKTDIMEGMERKTAYEKDDPDTDIYHFDKIFVTIGNKGSVRFTAEYEVEKGIFIMTEKASGARPITYADMRLDEDILTADFKDKDILIRMKWQKID